MSDPDPDLKDSKDLIESFISHTSDALKARRYYLGLEELSRARVVLDGVQAVRDNQQAIEKGMPGFEGEWAKTAVALKDLNGNPAPPADVPAVVAALAQSAQSKAIPVLRTRLRAILGLDSIIWARRRALRRSQTSAPR